MKTNPVIAHRGAFKKNHHPENSLAALKEAIDLKCAGSEFDVHMTADEILVINHDADFQGLEIEKSTYQQLADYPLANGEQLPTLQQYLLAGKNDFTKLILEIKPSGISKERGIKVAEKCLAMVEKVGVEDLVIYISFDYNILTRIQQLKPRSHTLYLNGDLAPEQLKADSITGADYHFSVFRIHPDWIKRAKANNLVLNAWTVNEKEDMLWLLENEFDFITTNDPESLFELLKTRNKI